MIDNGIYPQDPSLETLAHPELSKQGFWMQDWIDKLVLDTAALWTAKGIGKFDPFETLREAVSCVGVGLHDLDSVFFVASESNGSCKRIGLPRGLRVVYVAWWETLHS